MVEDNLWADGWGLVVVASKDALEELEGIG